MVEKVHRKTIRLKEYDYSSPGYYFITICTKGKASLLGSFEKSELKLNNCGDIVVEELLRTELIRSEVKIDYFVVMPNHIHAIIIIEESKDNLNVKVVGANGRSPLRMQPKSLSTFVSGFKSICTKRINEVCKTPFRQVWQRNYFEHVIRNDKELYEIRNYILLNPLNWCLDEYNNES